MSAEAVEPTPEETLEEVIKERDSLKNRLTITKGALQSVRAVRDGLEARIAPPAFRLWAGPDSGHYNRIVRGIVPVHFKSGSWNEIQLRWREEHAYGHTKRSLELDIADVPQLIVWLSDLMAKEAAEAKKEESDG